MIHLTDNSLRDPVSAESGVWFDQVRDPVLVFVPADPASTNITLAGVYDAVMGQTPYHLIHGLPIVVPMGKVRPEPGRRRNRPEHGQDQLQRVQGSAPNGEDRPQEPGYGRIGLIERPVPLHERS